MANTFRIPIVLARNHGIALAFSECSFSAAHDINEEQKRHPFDFVVTTADSPRIIVRTPQSNRPCG
jgi:hypothetical protein